MHAHTVPDALRFEPVVKKFYNYQTYFLDSEKKRKKLDILDSFQSVNLISLCYSSEVWRELLMPSRSFRNE